MIMRTTNFTIAGILLLDAGINAVDVDIMNTHNHDRFENAISRDERQRRIQQNNRAVDDSSAHSGRNQGWQNNDSAVYTVTDEDVITDINPAVEIRAQRADARAEKRRQGDNNGAGQDKEPRTDRRKRADAGNDAHTNDVDTNDKQDTSGNRKERNSQTSTNGGNQQPKNNENGNNVQVDAEKKNNSGNKLSQKEKKAKNKDTNKQTDDDGTRQNENDNSIPTYFPTSSNDDGGGPGQTKNDNSIPTYFPTSSTYMPTTEEGGGSNPIGSLNLPPSGGNSNSNTETYMPTPRDGENGGGSETYMPTPQDDGGDDGGNSMTYQPTYYPTTFIPTSSPTFIGAWGQAYQGPLPKYIYVPGKGGKWMNDGWGSEPKWVENKGYLVPYIAPPTDPPTTFMPTTFPPTTDPDATPSPNTKPTYIPTYFPTTYTPTFSPVWDGDAWGPPTASVWSSTPKTPPAAWPTTWTAPKLPSWTAPKPTWGSNSVVSPPTTTWSTTPKWQSTPKWPTTPTWPATTPKWPETAPTWPAASKWPGKTPLVWQGGSSGKANWNTWNAKQNINNWWTANSWSRLSSSKWPPQSLTAVTVSPGGKSRKLKQLSGKRQKTKRRRRRRQVVGKEHGSGKKKRS